MIEGIFEKKKEEALLGKRLREADLFNSQTPMTNPSNVLLSNNNCLESFDRTKLVSQVKLTDVLKGSVYETELAQIIREKQVAKKNSECFKQKQNSRCDFSKKKKVFSLELQ